MGLIGIKITGIEYIIWFLLAGLLVTLNFKLLSRKIILKQTYFSLLFILGIFCFLNYFFADTSLIKFLQGAFFTFLFAVNFILFYNIKIEKHDYLFVVKAIIVVLTAMAVLIYAERFLAERNYTSFLRGVQTLVKDSGFASTLLNINIILCLGIFIIKRKINYLYIAIFSFITIVLMLFLKAIVASLFIFSVFVFIFFDRRVRKIILFSLAGLVLLFFIILGTTFMKEVQYKAKLYFGSGSEATPRNALYIAGFQIARDYFPFGSGQGTFGSYPVGKSYSNIYYKYGLDKRYGLGPEAIKSTKENFLFDTYWSHIIGEMGFIAAFFYLWLWCFPALKTFPFLIHSNKEIKAFAFIITMTIVTIFIESLALSIPEQLVFIMLYAGLGAIGYKILFQEKNELSAASLI